MSFCNPITLSMLESSDVDLDSRMLMISCKSLRSSLSTVDVVFCPSINGDAGACETRLSMRMTLSMRAIVDVLRCGVGTDDGVVRQNHHLDVQHRVFTNAAHAHAVTPVSITVQPWLWSIFLLQNVDSVFGSRWTLKSSGLTLVVSKTLLDGLDGWRLVLELDRDALSVAVRNSDSVTLGRNADLIVRQVLHAVTVSSKLSEDLLGLPLDLLLLSRNIWNKVVEDVDTREAWRESSAGNSLHGGGGEQFDRSELVNQWSQWSDKTCGGAVRNTHNFLALEMTTKPASLKAFSIGPAYSASRPEKTTAQSLNASGVHSETTISPALSGIRLVCFQSTASLYFFPAEREDAPKTASSNCGCSLSSWMNRWPTDPVAPKTPAFLSAMTIND
ncbi:hypothetical protein OGAPHI_001448 [Ogataea philodendri]|uniref:Uncharacterized protein n=1 Tax=Ogataea philodendri TaxID=1378263 RepID=A0A9P8PDJ6_9ASCO|nr:uncharacterized protein OGAPHI_001448 [Ogataea philodendri]KAH3669327.1 hypothetical protein OGAPHI_001448 [Ogataea philodendri]